MYVDIAYIVQPSQDVCGVHKTLLLFCIPWASSVGYLSEVDHTVWVLAHAARLTGNTRAHRCLSMNQIRRGCEEK